MDFNAERAGIIQLIEHTVLEQKLTRLSGRIRVQWNTRLVNAVARAGMLGTGRSGEWIELIIDLSQPVWPTMDHNDRYESVLHELAHLIVGDAYGEKALHHGSEWVYWMRRLGVPPDVTHKGVAHIVGKCPCQIRIVKMPEAMRVMVNLRSNPKAIYRCKSCKRPIVFDLPEWSKR